MSRVQLLVKPVPDAIIDAVNAEAASTNVPAQDVIARVVSECVGETYEPRQASAKVVPVGYGKIFVRVQQSVKQKLQMRAAERNATIRGLVLEALAKHFQMPAPDVRRQAPSRGGSS